MNNKQSSAIARFRQMHESGCFVLPNPWDVGGAVFLQHLGFEALATTSAGFAFSQGLPDTVSAVSRDLVLDHIRDVVAATSLPVNADFQTGYADDPEGVAANVRLCIATGVAGLSIEDGTGNTATPLYEFDLAVERVRSARAAIDSSGVAVVLTARCEAGLLGVVEPLPVALERLDAYSQAGADCLFAPGLAEPDQVAAIIQAVSPKPVNVLVSRPSPALSVSRLAELGVRRISLGSALSRVAWGAFIRSARSIKETGSFDAFAEAAAFSELEEVFSKKDEG